jgi:hypothetical protein
MTSRVIREGEEELIAIAEEQRLALENEMKKYKSFGPPPTAKKFSPQQDLEKIMSNVFGEDPTGVETVIETEPEEVTAAVEEEQGLPEDPVERMKRVAEFLAQFDEKAPSFDTLMKWKTVHKDLFVLNADTFMFVYRYLTRQEWKKIQSDPECAKMNPDQVNEIVFKRCLLWPKFSPA